MTGRIIINTNHPVLKDIFDEPIPVLFYKEDEDTVAHALTLDILAYGEDEKEAGKELEGMIKTHISECLENGKPDLIWKNAPDSFFIQYISERSVHRLKKMDEVKKSTLSQSERGYRLPKIYRPIEFKVKLPERKLINSWERSEQLTARA